MRPKEAQARIKINRLQIDASLMGKEQIRHYARGKNCRCEAVIKNTNDRVWSAA